MKDRCDEKGTIGSSFDSWIQEEGLYKEVTAAAVKRVFVRQINQEA